MLGVPDGSDCKESACNAEDPRSIPGSGRSPRGSGYTLQGVTESDSTEQLTLSFFHLDSEGSLGSFMLLVNLSISIRLC